MNLLKRETKHGKGLKLIIDMGSGSVGAAYACEVTKNGKVKTELTAISRKPVFFREDLNFEIFLNTMTHALTDALKEIHDTHRGVPESINIFLRSPWYSAQIREIKSSRDAEFTITHRMLTELINKESALFESTAAAKYQELHNELAIIEQKTISVELNGYQVSEPIGARAKSLSLALYISASPKIVLATIHETVHRIFPHKKITDHSYLLPMYILLRDFVGKEENFVFLDIGGEISELSIIKNGILAQSATFPIGVHKIVRTIMDKEGSTFESAFSKIRMYREGALTEEESVKLEKLLAPINDIWIQEFSDALSSMLKSGTVPGTIYLSTDENIISWATKVIENEVFHRYTATDRTFEVIPIATKLLADHITLSSSVLHDTFLEAEALYANHN